MTDTAEELVAPPAGPVAAPRRPRASTIVIALVVVLVMVAGGVLTVTGRAAQSEARRDLASASAVLPQRQQAQKDAEAELVSAQKRLSAVREDASSVAKKARIALPTAADLLIVERRKIEIIKAKRDAIVRADPSGYNSQVDLQNVQIDRKNALLRQLRAVLGE